MPSDRHSRIRAHLFQNGESSVHDLAAAVGCSLATLRRDLNDMETAGQIERSHGGARLAREALRETGFDAREAEQIGAKRALARAAARLLEPESTVFLDAGTTVLQLARHLRLDPLPLSVFTNGLVVARELSHLHGIDVYLLGGRFRPENMSLVGPLAEMMLETLQIDQLFLGASAISPEGLVSSHSPEEARLNALMARQARKTTVLADASKIGQRATYSVLRLGRGQTLLTNRPPAAALAAALKKNGAQLMVAADG